jgi:hypothetical protein
MSKFKLMTEEQKEVIEWLRVQKEFLGDNKRDIFISESGNYPLVVDLLSETSADSINNRLSSCNLPVIGFEPVEDVADDSTYKLDGLNYEEAESLALEYMDRINQLICEYLDKYFSWMPRD